MDDATLSLPHQTVPLIKVGSAGIQSPSYFDRIKKEREESRALADKVREDRQKLLDELAAIDLKLREHSEREKSLEKQEVRYMFDTQRATRQGLLRQSVSKHHVRGLALSTITDDGLNKAVLSLANTDPKEDENTPNMMTLQAAFACELAGSDPGFYYQLAQYINEMSMSIDDPAMVAIPVKVEVSNSVNGDENEIPVHCNEASGSTETVINGQDMRNRNPIHMSTSASNGASNANIPILSARTDPTENCPKHVPVDDGGSWSLYPGTNTLRFQVSPNTTCLTASNLTNKRVQTSSSAEEHTSVAEDASSIAPAEQPASDKGQNMPRVISPRSGSSEPRQEIYIPRWARAMSQLVSDVRPTKKKQHAIPRVKPLMKKFISNLETIVHQGSQIDMELCCARCGRDPDERKPIMSRCLHLYCASCLKSTRKIAIRAKHWPQDGSMMLPRCRFSGCNALLNQRSEKIDNQYFKELKQRYLGQARSKISYNSTPDAVIGNLSEDINTEMEVEEDPV